MPQVYDSNDLFWTHRGDLLLGHSGDIADTYNDPLRSVYQEIRTRLQADLGDWILSPDIGASLADFVGEPNNKLVAEGIKTRIISALTRHGFINSKDLKVMYIPIDVDKIMFRISLSVASTPRNRGSKDLIISALYSYSENNVYVP